MKLKLIFLFTMLALLLTNMFTIANSAQIARQHTATIQPGLPIKAGDLNDELNNIINGYNSDDLSLTAILSGTQTLSGTITFSNFPNIPVTTPGSTNPISKTYADSAYCLLT